MVELCLLGPWSAVNLSLSCALPSLRTRMTTAALGGPESTGVYLRRARGIFLMDPVGLAVVVVVVVRVVVVDDCMRSCRLS